MQYSLIFVNIWSILVTPTHVCYVVQSRRHFFCFHMPFWKKTCFCHLLCFLSFVIYIYIYITYYILHITYYILPIDCLLIAYRLPLMPICSAIMDMGPGPIAQKRRGPGPGPAQRPFWALGPDPGPISIMAEHMGIKGNP